MYEEKLPPHIKTKIKFILSAIVMALVAFFGYRPTESPLPYLGIIVAGLLVGLFILYVSKVRVRVNNDGIFRSYNLSPRSDQKLIDSSNITSISARPDQTAYESGTPDLCNILTREGYGSVRIESKDGEEEFVSSRDPELLKEKIEDLKQN